MSNHIIKIVLAAMMSLCVEQALAQTTTGQQCKALLNPVVDQLFAYQNRANYYTINNEIPNVISTDLENIAANKSSTDAVKNIALMAQRVLDKCYQTCHGLPLSNQKTLNCALMGKTNPRDLRFGLPLLADNAETKAQEEKTTTTTVETDSDSRPSAACSFEPERPECIIASQEPEVKVEETVSTQESTTSPQYANESLDDVYKRHANQLNEQQYRAEDRAQQGSVW